MSAIMTVPDSRTTNVLPRREPETWEDFVSAGIDAREQKDAMQWRIGDLGHALISQSEDDETAKTTKTEYAKAIGVKRQSLCEYSDMAAFYPSGVARATPLSYSHYRMAWRKNRESLDGALALLTEANDAGWTVDAMARELAVRSGKPEPLDTTLYEAYRQLSADFGGGVAVRLIVKDDGTFTLKRKAD